MTIPFPSLSLTLSLSHPILSFPLSLIAPCSLPSLALEVGPLNPARGSGGALYNSPSGVRGGALAANAYLA